MIASFLHWFATVEGDKLFYWFAGIGFVIGVGSTFFV